MKSQGQKEINQWEDKDWFSAVLGIWPYPWSVVTHFTTVGSLNPTLTISHSDPDSQDSLFFLQSPTSLDGLEAFGVCGSTVTSPYIAFLVPQSQISCPFLREAFTILRYEWVSLLFLTTSPLYLPLSEMSYLFISLFVYCLPPSTKRQIQRSEYFVLLTAVSPAAEPVFSQLVWWLW